MRICDLFLFLPPPHIWVHHFAYDWARTNNRYLDDDVIKFLWAITRKRSHLRATLHLKHPNSVCLLKCLVDCVVLRQVSQVDFVAIVFGNHVQAILEYGHHAKTKQVDLDNPKISAILFIPLHNCSSWHRCSFQRNNGIQCTLTDSHPSRVLAKMAREILDTHTKFEVLCYARMR